MESIPYLKDAQADAGIALSLQHDWRRASTVLASGWFDCCLLVQQPEAALEALRPVCRDTALFAVRAADSDLAAGSLLNAGADAVIEPGLPWETVQGMLARRANSASQVAPLPAAGRGDQTPPIPTGLSRQPALSLFRDVSRVLADAERWERMLSQFLLLLRDLTGLQRIAVFLETPSPRLGGEGCGTLRCEAAYGIPHELRECMRLSRESGLGARMDRRPTVVFLDDPEGDERIRREISGAGGVLALPINDREGNLGVAILGERLAGSWQDEELSLLALLLEELGVAIRQSWMREQSREDERLLLDIFGSMQSGCLVVGASGEVLQVNPAFRKMMGSGASPELTALPAALRECIERVRSEGGDTRMLAFASSGFPERSFHASVIPLGLPLAPPRALLVVLEDRTPFEEEKAREAATSRDELASTMAKRFAHEVRNSLVPLVTHLHLFDERERDPEFRASLRRALATETARISRFSDQMLFFSPRRRETPRPLELLQTVHEVAEALIAGWDRRSLEIRPVRGGEAPPTGIWVEGEDKALRHALDELLRNALQVQPAEAAPHLRLEILEGEQVALHVLDQGPGVAPEERESLFEPFVTSRNTGIGLGLAIARRVAEHHGGSIKIMEAAPPYRTDVVFTLPTTRTVCHAPLPTTSSSR